MCLGIPGKVVATYREHDVLMGKVDFSGVSKRVCLEHIPEAQPGDYVLVHIGPALGVIDPPVFGDIARTMTRHPGHVIFASAVLAGWLMGLLSWLGAAGRDTIRQIAVVWLVATAIGLGRLHHVVVGSVEVLAGLFSGQGVTAADYGYILLWTTLGNALGGSVFVALIKYNSAVGTNQSG